MKISACWIVKDEEKNIAASILSVKDCAQELLVVDTGSTDDTVCIAKALGARVEHFVWTDDFSAARNFCLSLAVGDYVIFIDADEYFDPPLGKADRSIIKDAFQNLDVAALLIPRTEVSTVDGRVGETLLHGRIFRRLAIKWQSKIHEIVKLKNGSRPVAVTLDQYRLMHSGYMGTAGSEKLLRNIAILEAEQPKLNDDISRFINRVYLMQEHAAIGNEDRAYENCRYVLDHYHQWAKVCQTFLFDFIRYLYTAILLVAGRQSYFNKDEIYQKLFQVIKDNYPKSREAALADLYYQMIFDYQDGRFVSELSLAEKDTQNMRPAVLSASIEAEAAIYAAGAVTVYRWGDGNQARCWANKALKLEPELNKEILQGILDETITESRREEEKVTACWIVKNEADTLAASIKSVKDCVTELIVVDTGSSDHTTAIAGALGARVEHFQWTDDFSAARNFCLSLAAGNYVIFLDGDEYFEPALRAADRFIIGKIFDQTNADVLRIPRVEINAHTKAELGSEPYIRIMRRDRIYYEGRVHEVIKGKEGALPQGCTLTQYRLLHTGYSPDRTQAKVLRNIHLLEAEQAELKEGNRLLHNKSYLMREYFSIQNYKKAVENCRYLLDHHIEWQNASKEYEGYLGHYYVAIRLAAGERFQFSRQEVYQKIIKGIKESYPYTWDAAWADLYYQVLFDYREDRFLKEIREAEKNLEQLPPMMGRSRQAQSRQAEGEIYGQAAVAAYYRGDFKIAQDYAKNALERGLPHNSERLQQIISDCFVPQEEVEVLILSRRFQQAYDLIISELNKGSLQHTLLEFLLIVAEKATGQLAQEAQKQFDTAMEMLNEAIELSDVVNTSYTKHLEGRQKGRKSIADLKSQKITPDLLTLHQLAAPIYEKKGLREQAAASYELLCVKGREVRSE